MLTFLIYVALIDIFINLQNLYIPGSTWCDLFEPSSTWKPTLIFSRRSNLCFPPLKMAKSSIQFYFPISSTVVVALSWMRSSAIRLDCIRWPSLSVRPYWLYFFVLMGVWQLSSLEVTLRYVCGLVHPSVCWSVDGTRGRASGSEITVLSV